MAYEIMKKYFEKGKQHDYKNPYYKKFMFIVIAILIIGIIEVFIPDGIREKIPQFVLAVICIPLIIAVTLYFIKVRKYDSENCYGLRNARIQDLREVLCEHSITSDKQIQDLICLYQKYLDKCSAESKWQSALLTLIIDVIGVVVAIFKNISDDFGVIFLFVIIVTAVMWYCIIFLINYFDTTRTKYETMIERLQELLISNSNDVILPAMPDAATENKCLEQPYIKTVEYSANLKYEEALKRI
jgi:hypothetical protein